VLHLLYSRFFTRVLRDLGWVSVSEPFARLLTQGMVIKDGAKMSKSRGNVVDPDELIGAYGADTARLFSLFAAPPEKDLEWSERGVEGAWRFHARVWRLAFAAGDTGEKLAFGDPGAPTDDAAKALWSKTHDTIMRVTRDIGERMHFNTAIAAVMELVNAIYEYRAGNNERFDAVTSFAIGSTLRLLFPFVPHIPSEIWSRLVVEPAIDDVGWPEHDDAALASDFVEIGIQLNGKLRSRLSVAADASGEELERLALADEKVAAVLAGKRPRKVIVVPGRLVNVVV
jgi:leucyl-tRNA synthetase